MYIDDLGSTLGDSKVYSDFLQKGSHHSSCAVFNLDQLLFRCETQLAVILFFDDVFYSDQKEKRKQGQNTHVFVLFRNPRCQMQIATLSRQMGIFNSKTVQSAYKQSTCLDDKFGYLILDTRAQTADHVRLISKIFPSEYPPICFLET